MFDRIPVDKQQQSTSKSHHPQLFRLRYSKTDSVRSGSTGRERKQVLAINVYLMCIYSCGLLDLRLAKQTCEDGGDGVSLFRQCTASKRAT
jgi:hypothetical protein